MELLYNPDRMPESEIRATFVARQPLVDELIRVVKGQPEGAGVQHVLIIAPRGMGKTTLLLMLHFAVRDRGLDRPWQVVRFPEESYGIYDLADFWLQTLSILAVEAQNPALMEQVEGMKQEFTGSGDLQEAALALLRGWCRSHRRRLLLLVDNLDLILDQIHDERENARLRTVLMNEGDFMLVGGATTFFHAARAYEQPLYNFFKIYNLENLSYPQVQDLLRRRATVDGLTGFEETLRANRVRLKVLQYFTGGNPRLTLMLYRIVTQSDVLEVRRGLEKLLDEVTPYYKAKIESLPPQQRKILDCIARITAVTSTGLTPGEIAREARLTPNQVSAQLKRLAETGYVRSANVRGRNAYYTLSEPLYAIWHQMRFGRAAREKMVWLLTFLSAYYEAEEVILGNSKFLHELTASPRYAELAEYLAPVLNAIKSGDSAMLERLSPELREVSHAMCQVVQEDPCCLRPLARGACS